jgi:lipopolysaccharide/colanic/teichoic acid biosynthesis glycosyltransferase
VTPHLALDSSIVRVSWPRRALDLTVATVTLVLMSPLFALIAIAVRFESRGPVIFRQERVGAGGRTFTMMKFRSMRPSARGPEVTASGDPRITRVGRVLRRLGLDELPQLLNIVRGDMTLVGPRPETPALAARYPPQCVEVFRYRPGLTGPAQVRLRDDETLPTGVVDVEAYYLSTIVPRRVAVDLEFQATASLRTTLDVIRETALYLTR